MMLAALGIVHRKYAKSMLPEYALGGNGTKRRAERLTKPPLRQNQWVGGGAVLVAKSNRFRGVRTVVGAGRDGFEVALRLRVESPGPA